MLEEIPDASSQYFNKAYTVVSKLKVYVAAWNHRAYTEDPTKSKYKIRNHSLIIKCNILIIYPNNIG